MKFIKYVMLILAAGASLNSAKAGKRQYTPLSQFKGTFNKQFGYAGKQNFSFSTDSDGKTVMKIVESKRYCSYAGINLNGFSGMQSIYIGVDCKTSNIANTVGACVYYYWLDKKGKKIGHEIYALRQSGTSDWQRFEKIVSSPDPLNTGGLCVAFALYSPKGNDGSLNGYALYKNPGIRPATPNDSKEIQARKEQTKKIKKPPQVYKITDSSFLRGINNKMPGVPFCVEQGKFGWFMLWTRHPIPDVDGMKITAPKGVDFEFYLQRGGKAAFRPGNKIIQDNIATTEFLKLKRARWNSWMNVLIFKVAKDIPKDFDVTLTLLDKSGKSLYNRAIPVRIIAASPRAVYKTKFENRVYYAHPFRWVDFNDPRAKIANKLLDYLKERGFSSAGYLVAAKEQPFPVKKGEVITNFTRLPYQFKNTKVMRELMKKHNIAMAMTPAGIRSATELETQSLINNGVPFYLDMLKRTNNQVYQNRELVWLNDYEPYAFEGPTTRFSFAPESIVAFRKFIKAPDKLKLTPAIILGKYEKEWTKFRCMQHALVVKAGVDALKKFEPQAIYALSSETFPGKDENKDEFFRRFGVDLRMMDDFVDLHAPMIYNRNTAYYHRVEATTAALKKPVMPTITCGYGLSPRDPQRLTKLMAAAAFLNARGVYHWPSFMGMDAQEIQSNQRAMQLITRLEPILEQTELIKRNNQVICPDAKHEQFYYAIRQSDGGAGSDYIIFLANDDNNQTFYPLIKLRKVKKSLYVTDFITRQSLLNLKKQQLFNTTQLKSGFRVKLPPNSMRIIRCSTSIPTTAGNAIDANENKLAFQRHQKIRKETLKGLSKYGMSYRQQGSILTVKTPVQSLEFDLNNSGNGSWTALEKGKKIQLLKSINGDYFDYPGKLALRNIQTSLEAANITKDSLTLILYYSVKTPPFEGLAFRKTFLISRDKPMIKVNCKIIPVDGFRQFAYRLNCVSENAKAVLIVDGKKRPAPAGAKVIGGDIFTRKDSSIGKYIDYPWSKIKGTFSSNQCALTVPDSKYVIYCNYNDKVKALMSWHSGKIRTMELIYDKAYDHNDPHRAAVWESNYVLTVNPNK